MPDINGTNNDDTLFGIVNDRNMLAGFAGNDYLNRGDLQDLLYGGDGGDVLSGNDGSDQLYGEAGNDHLAGGDGGDQLKGDDGDDILDGDDGGDYLFSGTGNDILNGGSGDDIIYAIEGVAGDIKTIDGGLGDDVIVAGAGTDNIAGGTGIDRVHYNFSKSAVNVNLQSGKGSGGDAAQDTYHSIEDIVGSAFNDTLIGNGASNEISGMLGNDVIRGGAGGDTLDGGEGIDTLDYRGSDAAVKVNLATGSTFGGDAQGDQFVGFESLYGSDFSDILTGSSVANTLSCGSGNDLLSGGAGNDVLIGGSGADSLTGGTGADTFVFKAHSDSTVASAGQDTIFDFGHSQGDTINLKSIDAFAHASGNQAFLFKGTAAFSGHDGELRYVKEASDTYVYGDVNGDKKADFSIHLDDAVALVATDFFL